MPSIISLVSNVSGKTEIIIFGHFTFNNTVVVYYVRYRLGTVCCANFGANVNFVLLMS